MSAQWRHKLIIFIFCLINIIKKQIRIHIPLLYSQNKLNKNIVSSISNSARFKVFITFPIFSNISFSGGVIISSICEKSQLISLCYKRIIIITSCSCSSGAPCTFKLIIIESTRCFLSIILLLTCLW